VLLVKAAVLGNPVSHSLSPVLHNSAYRSLGLDHTYSAIEVTESNFQSFISSLDEEWLGVSLTMPLKEAAFQVATTIDALASQTGAINTLVFDSGISGFNTDVAGIVDALTEKGISSAHLGTLFGSGATARSALAAMSQLGITQVHCVARNELDVAVLIDLGKQIGIEVAHSQVNDSQWLESDVVINTTPVGVLDEIAKDVWQPKGILLDVVYHPWPTQFAASWLVCGGEVTSGLSMLLHQAGHQVTLLTNEAAPIDDMRAGLNLELLARGLSTI
jgi:shikimate dehydrogenase